MAIAARNNEIDAFPKLIAAGACDWDHGLWGAALGGHRIGVEFFIKRGANDWANGMERALEGGHWELAQFFGTKLIEPPDWDEWLPMAVQSQSRASVLACLKELPPDHPTQANWNRDSLAQGGLLDLDSLIFIR